MLEVKLWHNKKETKNVKVPIMVEFIETCDQYSRRFNFGNFFNAIILPSFLLAKNRSSENGRRNGRNEWVREEWIISFCLGGHDKNLGESLAWGHK